jgi:hypothetical protein
MGLAGQCHALQRFSLSLQGQEVVVIGSFNFCFSKIKGKCKKEDEFLCAEMIKCWLAYILIFRSQLFIQNNLNLT